MKGSSGERSAHPRTAGPNPTGQVDAVLVRCLELLGLVMGGETVILRPLAGGVSSDILEVSSGERRFCVKRALPRLKVAALWTAPVQRNAAEADWLRTIGRWFPDAAPAVLAEDRAAGLFAMAYLPPDRFPVWKAELMAGRIDPTFAGAVGHRLAAIHARSAAEPGLAETFDNLPTFEAIRVEPYLRAAARAHPDLARPLEALAEHTLTVRRSLVHGDVSPKNILVGPRGPVFLDAECACWGDPAFDLAFCLNHLLLKAAWRPDLAAAFLSSYAALTTAYLAGVDWEPAAGIEARCATLLPALLLARVDGKSPVEYLDEGRRGVVRAAARAMLAEPHRRIADVASRWSRALA